MIVLDSSAAVAGLLHDGAARTSMSTGQVHTLHLADSEVVSVLRRSVTVEGLTAAQAWVLLDAWLLLGVTRYAAKPLLGRVWQLRNTLSAYDAGYVALAEALDCSLVTADGRLSRAPGIRCPVTVVPH